MVYKVLIIFAVLLASNSDTSDNESAENDPEYEISNEVSDEESGEAASRSIISRGLESEAQSPTSRNSDSDDETPTDTRKNVYKCVDCSEEFNAVSVVALHRKSIHGSSEFFKCHICFSNFRHGKSLTTHLRRHEQEKVSKKEKSFRRFAEDRNYSEAEKIFKCIDCDEKFARVCNLRHHRVDVHGADAQHAVVCHICRYSNSKPVTFRIHILGHISTEVHKCSKCERSFNVFKKLHMKLQHQIMLQRKFDNFPVNPLCDKIIVRCPKCEAEFECEERLLEHSKNVHGS